MAAPDTVVDFAEKLAAFDELWSPKIIGQVNDPPNAGDQEGSERAATDEWI
jgi:hypothetical protein